jgi:hypothetical protein
MSTTCDIYATFGAGSPTTTGVACTLYGEFRNSRCGAANLPDYTHYIDVANSVTITDNMSRIIGSNALTYGDGMEVRIPSGVANRYVVVWVEPSPSGGKRVYLMRHSVSDWTQL